MAADHKGGRCEVDKSLSLRVGGGAKGQKGQGTGGQGLAKATHMGLDAEEVEAIMVDGEDTGGWYSDVAAALDEEEGGAEQGEGAEEACRVERCYQDTWARTTGQPLPCPACCLQKLLSAPVCSDLSSSPPGLFLFPTC